MTFSEVTATLMHMAMSHRDRFKLRSQVLAVLESGDWTWQRITLVLSELGLPQPNDDSGGPDLTDIVSGLTEQDLTELYALVFDVSTSEVMEVVETSTGSENWKSGYARVFLSHSAKHKELVGEVSDELAVLGIHGFVAHDTMAYSKPWQDQIEAALKSMQAFVAIVHPEFNDSAFCHQEVGWALGRRVPHYVVRMGIDPKGLLGRDQWPSGAGRSARDIAHLIYQWAANLPDMGNSITDGLFSALSDAGNYYDAEAAAKRIVALGDLAAADWARLNEAYWSNNQVYGGVLPTKQLRPFYEQNGQAWPPPKPQQEIGGDASAD
jgi:hypothetical protein